MKRRAYNKVLDELSIQLTPYIYRVFNYFNGKVNVINSCAKIDIVIGPYFDIYGHTDWPYAIKIFPYAIVVGVLSDLDETFNIVDKFNTTKIWDERYIEAIKSTVIDTVVHELFHIDQIYNYDIERDPGQYQKIEADVWSITYTYIMNNIHRISIDLDLKYKYTMTDEVFDQTAPTHYRRLQEFDYYMQLFEAITGRDFYEVNQKLNFSNNLYEEDNINFIINGTSIEIKKNGRFITEAIPYISKLIYERYLSYQTGEFELYLDWIHYKDLNKYACQINLNVRNNMHEIMSSRDLNILREEHKKE